MMNQFVKGAEGILCNNECDVEHIIPTYFDIWREMGVYYCIAVSDGKTTVYWNM